MPSGTVSFLANETSKTVTVNVSGTVSFLANETSKTVTVNVSGDSDVEGDEGFTVTLSNPTAGAQITGASATGPVLNDDTALSIAALDAVKSEGDGATTGFTFTVTRTGDVSGATDVDYAVTGSGSPADAADFGGVLPSGTVSFLANETSKTVTVDVSGDSDVEADEGFTVTLSNPTGGAQVTGATATGTVLNDDTALAIAPLDAVKSEGDGAATGYTFTVTRTGDVSGATDVDYVVACRLSRSTSTCGRKIFGG